MKRSRFTDSQILKELCRKQGFSEGSFYLWGDNIGVNLALPVLVQVGTNRVLDPSKRRGGKRIRADMFRIIATLFVALLGVSQTEHARAADGGASAFSDSELKIRNARTQFNVAIARQDVEAIGGFLAPSYHIVTGRSSQSHGAATEVDSWREVFRDDPSFVCERTPTDVAVNDGWGLAQELGRWICSYRANGEPVRSNGVYAAKWQRTEMGGWLLQAEVFTTLECRGPPTGCRAPDRIE